MAAAVYSRALLRTLGISARFGGFRLALAVVLTFTVAGIVVDGREPSWLGALDAASGLALACCGVILIRQLTGRRSGALLMAASVAWFAGTVLPVLGTPGGVGTVMALTLHRGPLVNGILTAPSRRSRSVLTVAVVTSAWITGIVTPLARSDGVSLAVGASVALAGLSLTRGNRPDPLTNAAVFCACAYGVALGVPAALRLSGIGNDRVAITFYMVAVIALSIALALTARSARESAVVALVIDLGDQPDGSTLRRTLARAVGDPELVVGIWLEDEQRYVDEFGQPLFAASSHSETPLFVDGRRVGALFHAPSTIYEAGIVEDAAAVAALAVENVRLQADAKRSVAELRAARRRIVEQTQEQRWLIGEQIREGADRQLDAAEGLLRNAAATLSNPALLDELVETRASILSLATGLDASLPPKDRLRAAAERRTRRCPVPVKLRFEPVDLPDQWQHALLLVFAEAVTNAIKHSGCTCISSELRAVPGGVTLEITDDGIGGADASGFGLSGLRDRIGALGGSIEVATADGGGTTIRATLLTGRPSASRRRT